ncbi:MAG TPA: flagellar biosynthetic protein FliO [Noviherbaspirillum sp.]|uniref:flagellar biosynthetic protein FliO n=1 Tax=Noviherbaspirillum sp. TaxID=1926288 RepID=UPI002B464C56|nr:flagellar biosynthetic protein FliO [Noviherbaspirillum sp.]HJV88494.1 flagellar biosynthetic protein FliO [Noviherbaspirillum sp.]
MMRLSLLPALLLAAPVHAAEQSPASASGLLQVSLGLAVVLALMAGAAWILKRIGVAGAGGNNVVKVVGGVSVGNRERVIVVEVADQWIVVGVAPGRVNALSTLPRQDISAAPADMPGTTSFAAWLKQTVEKRNGHQ